MATRNWRQAIGPLHAVCAFVYVVSTYAAPNIAFPFNAQVPTVARVGEPYIFQLSASTFTPEGTNYTYSLSGQPAWLTVESTSRTLTGTPTSVDAGASSFTLTAADDDGPVHMACTMVVSTDPAPQLDGDIGRQLAATANLSSSAPPVVTLLPSTHFNFQFQPDSFIDIVQRKLYYYATLTDHTPLPSWLLFNPQSLTFDGLAPDLSAFPQSWEIDLIASDVAGFAGATASFTMAVGTQQLAFVPAQQNVTITEDTALSFTALQNQLFLNGAMVNPRSLALATVSSLPPWASFDPSTLAITGTVPKASGDQTISVAVTDQQGTSATATIYLVSSNSSSVSLFTGSIGSLTAYSGQMFEYQFPNSLFTEANVVLTVAMPSSVDWLHFDPSTRELQGTVPTQTTTSSFQATLMAHSSSTAAEQTQAFTINVRPTSSSSTSGTSSGSPSSSTTSSSVTPPVIVGKTSTGKHLSAGIIAAIVIVAVVLLLACFLAWPRCVRREGYERHSASPARRTISRPIPTEPVDAITVTTAMQRDVEKTAGKCEQDAAPQIALNFPSQTNNRRSRLLNRFSRISQVSSLGHGEEAVRADTNIPEWGTDSAALHTPHDSFSVAAELARVSRQESAASPTKRAMKRLRERGQSRQSIGLGIDHGGSGLMPRHSSRAHRRGASSLGFSAAMDRSSQASLSTRGTSVLSTRPSDFPPPPSRSTLTMSRSRPRLSITEEGKRKSIRLVARSESIADNRSMQEKRQSYIRKRASTSFQSPLFAHGSRASTEPKMNGPNSTTASSAGSTRRSQRGRSALTSYSESSSLEPQARDPRRFSAKIRSAFPPNFPRALDRSSLGADDEHENDEDEWSSVTSTISEEDMVAQPAGDLRPAQHKEQSPISDHQWRAEAALPRHQRNWVMPGEASPTPPPAPPTSRQPSSARRSTPSGSSEVPRQKWKERLKERSSSPLSTGVNQAVQVRSSKAAENKKIEKRKSTLNEPLSLVSNDSVSRAKLERPRLVHHNSRRPVSVEEAKRLSSLRAETGTETDTQAGSEVCEDAGFDEVELEGSGLMPETADESRIHTQRSNMSGPAFL